MAFHRGLNDFDLVAAVDDRRNGDGDAVDQVEMVDLTARLANVDETRAGANTCAARPALRVLYVDDQDSEAQRISAAIHDCPSLDVALFHADCPVDAEAICEAERIDIVVVDFWLGAGTTAHTLDDLCRRCTSGAIVLSSLDPDIVGGTIGETADLIVLSKSELDGAAFERAFRAIGHIN